MIEQIAGTTYENCVNSVFSCLKNCVLCWQPCERVKQLGASHMSEFEERLIAAKKSLFKLVAANCGVQNWCANTLMAAALSGEVLSHWRVPFVVKTGYLQFEEGAPLSVPTVWLETIAPTISEHPLITFAVVAPKGAIATRLMGQGVSLSEEALTPYFTEEARFDVDERSLPIDTLRAHATNLGAYLASFYERCNPESATAVRDMLTSVLDPDVAKVPVQMAVTE